MTREKKQVAILGALALVLIAVYGRALAPSAPTPTDTQLQVAGPESSASPTPSAAKLIPDRSVERKAQRQRAAALAPGRDPFTSRSMLAEASGLHLSGILRDPAEPIAILNGQMVFVGDEIGGYRVVEISPHNVSVTDGSETFQLTIAPKAPQEHPIED